MLFSGFINANYFLIFKIFYFRNDVKSNIKKRGVNRIMCEWNGIFNFLIISNEKSINIFIGIFERVCDNLLINILGVDFHGNII